MHAHSGEEYRQELRKGIERWGDRIGDLAWGVGSGFVGGARTGHVFCARVFDRVFMRFRARGAGRGDRARHPNLPRNPLMHRAHRARAAGGDSLKELSTLGSAPAATSTTNGCAPRIPPRSSPASVRFSEPPPTMCACTRSPGCPSTSGTEWPTPSKHRGGSAKSGGSGRCSRPTEVAPGELTRRIADVVNELGLQPWKPPEPLDPIEEEEVNLVVWMGVLESAH